MLFPAFSARRRAGVLAAACSLSAAGEAEAQSNYRLAPVGGRTTLLGGTGVVYGRDAAAAFLNPATAVLADDGRLAFAVNFYTMNLVVAPNWYQPGPTDRAVFGNLQVKSKGTTDFEFNALPSSLCLFLKVGSVDFLARRIKDPKARNARLGICFATIENQFYNFAAESLEQKTGSLVTRQAQSVSQSYSRFAVGPTYAMQITEALAVGLSLHGTLATHRSLFAATADTYGGPTGKPVSSTFYAGSRGDSFQFEPLVGATYRFGRQKVGLSFKFPSLHVYGVGGANRQSRYDIDGEVSTTTTGSGRFVSHSPMRISLGTGIEAKWGNAEINTSFSAPTNAYSANLEGNVTSVENETVTDRTYRATLTQRARGVVNASAGAEIFLSPLFSMLTGLSTDVSALSKGTLAGSSLFNYQPTRTHRVNASFGLASHGDGGELILGTELSAGWGDRLAVNSYQLPADIVATPQTTYQLMAVIAGSTSLKALKRAVVDAKKVLTQPRPKTSTMTPANPESRVVVPGSASESVGPSPMPAK